MRRMSMARGPWCRLLPAVLLGTCVACAHVPLQSESVKQLGIEASTSEVRTRLVELGRDVLRATELAADSIDARTTEPRIRRNTLLWRLSSVPAVSEAVLREDPVAAALDFAAYRGQLTAFLASAAGESTFGPDVVIARRGIAALSESWEAAADATGAHMTDSTRVKFEAWVAAHPIDRVPLNRSSPAGELAIILRSQGTGIGAAVGGMQESLARLEFRLSLANEYTVKEAAWLAQLATLDVAASPAAADLHGTLASTRGLVEGAPDLLQRERLALLADLDRQRRETIAAVAQEREILVAIEARERATVLDALDEQRRRVMLDADSLRMRAVTDVLHVADHVMLCVAAVLAGLV